MLLPISLLTTFLLGLLSLAIPIGGLSLYIEPGEYIEAFLVM